MDQKHYKLFRNAILEVRNEAPMQNRVLDWSFFISPVFSFLSRRTPCLVNRNHHLFGWYAVLRKNIPII